MMKRRVAALILAFAFMAGAALGEPESEFEYYIGEDGTACISGYAGSAVDLALPAELGGVAVTAVEEYAFYGLNDVQTAVVPEGYAVLGDCAFGWCSQLRRVTLPSSLRQVGKNPLIGCDVIQDVVTAGEAFAFEDGLLLNRDEGLVVACVALTAGEDVVIPDGVTEIGGGAFYNINTVKSVTLPPTLEAIGEDAFAYCYGLSRMEIPEGVGQIADTAFDGLDELVLIVAPDSYAQTWC